MWISPKENLKRAKKKNCDRVRNFNVVVDLAYAANLNTLAFQVGVTGVNYIYTGNKELSSLYSFIEL